jgi:hypothetical protein
MIHLKVIVEKHADGYVACPLGLKGVVVGEGNSFEGKTPIFYACSNLLSLIR